MAKIDWGGFSNAMSIGGLATGLVGSYYAAQTEKYKFESNALNFTHQQDMAEITADMFRSQSRQVGKAYDRQTMIKTLQAGSDQKKQLVAMAKSGGSIGYGSSAEVAASQRIMANIDKLTMDVNKVKAINDMKLRGVKTDIRADMYGVSASGQYASASGVSPLLNMSSTLLTGIPNIVKNWHS